MTGEITLRGRVLPIGGLKEKTMAAHRSGITRVLVPRQNEKDLQEIPKIVTDKVEIILVSHLDEVLGHALILGRGRDAVPHAAADRGARLAAPRSSMPAGGRAELVAASLTHPGAPSKQGAAARCGRIAQSEEQQPYKLRVAGSSPVPPTLRALSILRGGS